MGKLWKTWKIPMQVSCYHILISDLQNRTGSRTAFLSLKTSEFQYSSADAPLALKGLEFLRCVWKVEKTHPNSQRLGTSSHSCPRTGCWDKRIYLDTITNVKRLNHSKHRSMPQNRNCFPISSIKCFCALNMGLKIQIGGGKAWNFIWEVFFFLLEQKGLGNTEKGELPFLWRLEKSAFF